VREESNYESETLLNFVYIGGGVFQASIGVRERERVKSIILCDQEKTLWIKKLAKVLAIGARNTRLGEFLFGVLILIVCIREFGIWDLQLEHEIPRMHFPFHSSFVRVSRIFQKSLSGHARPAMRHKLKT